MRNNVEELLKQPYAQETLGMMGKLKSAKDYTEKELTELEPFFKRVEATAVPIHVPVKGEYDRKWWKEAVMYQIYPMSFCDSNGDGIGDINGIISKLDYLKDLGVDVVWLSPVYDSPNMDNGYDIRDYEAIHSDYGTMEDFDRLLDEVHSRGMKLIMDMVLNHTSDEHRWFQTAIKDPTSKYKDYYIWRKAKEDGSLPNNWTSFFSGNTWSYYPSVGEYALHVFSTKQMDLNWENPELREEVYGMLNRWLQKGVDGFRLDVINLISKFPGLPDGEPNGFVTGIEQYVYGPRMHEFLHEMNRRAFSKYDSFTVGEGCGLGPKTQVAMTLASREELNTTFCFHHFDEPGKGKYDIYRYNLNYLKDYMIENQELEDTDNWLTLVFENHDQPRFMPKITRIPEEQPYAAKLVALLEMTSRGTAFIYEGQELGMNTVEFNSPDEFRDVEAINKYHELIENGMSEEDAFRFVAPGTRDQTRAPMHWTHEANGGFTTGTPWLKVNENYTSINAADEEADENSILNFYKAMTKLRKQNKTLVYGHYETVAKEAKDFYAYRRFDADAEFYVEINLSDKPMTRPVEAMGEFVIGNYKGTAGELRPFEANLYRVR